MFVVITSHNQFSAHNYCYMLSNLLDFWSCLTSINFRRRKNASRTSLLGALDESAMSDSNTVSSSSQLSRIKEIIRPSSNYSVKYSQIPPQQGFLSLKPLYFEIPRSISSSYQSQTSQNFVGRQWVFREVHQHLSSNLPTNRGVIIKGTSSTLGMLIYALLDCMLFIGHFRLIRHSYW